MDMDYARLQASALMMTAYKDFVELSAKHSNDRGSGGNDFAGYPKVQHENAYATDEDSHDGPESLYEDTPEEIMDVNCAEWPVPQFFSLADLNPDDGSFYGGRAIGMPSSVAVNNGTNQNELLPVMRGRFYNNGL